ncbi:hypothetical protein FRC10_001205 [Ceratobasidium sp. 414]|nr:hypothetical protein FRC10_001205 [Ceratobasidium sp. 414]
MSSNNQNHVTDNNESSWEASTVVSDAASCLSVLTGAQTHTPTTTNTYFNTEGYTETGTDGRLSPAPSLYSLTSSLRDQSFKHVHGRSLNAHSDVYSLPADEEEAQRLYKQHRMFYHLAGNDHYYGLSQTVREVLAPTEQRERAVLDLGAPPPNCRFEIDDLNLGLEHFFGDTFDLVHARLLNSGVKDYAGLVDQISRCVRPGGLVIFTEVDFRTWSEDKRLLITPNFYTPLPAQGRSSVGLVSGASSKPGGSSASASMAGKGQPLTRLTDWAVPTWLATMTLAFENLVEGTSKLRAGRDQGSVDTFGALEADDTCLDEWTTHPNFSICGNMCQENLIALMRGSRPLLYSFLSEQEVAELEGNAVRELLAASNPMYVRVQVTSARKKRSGNQEPQRLYPVKCVPLGSRFPTFNSMADTRVDLTVASLFNVKDKIALVSGGGSGIGLMIAGALVQNGAKVYIASRKEKQLKESKAGCDALCDAFKKRESKLHILVNNSGATWGAPWENFPEKEGWDRVMALNVKSLFYMTSNLTEYLQKDATPLDPGRVVNISSVASKDTIANETGLSAKGQGLWSYNTSKAAVNHLTSTMAVTLAPKFITVNAICPGVYPSKMTAFGFSHAADALAQSHPMGRVGSPRDMAGLFLFLVSPGGAHITGAHIESDGGSRISGRGYSKL